MAVGALSPRTVFQHLKAHEARFGANKSTYWIWFELLWRDFFRFWTLKPGVRLFRARSIDYDVYSNHGNWLYLAGRGADPRQGRWFNPDKQAADHDPDGAYRALWAGPAVGHTP